MTTLWWHPVGSVAPDYALVAPCGLGGTRLRSGGTLWALGRLTPVGAFNTAPRWQDKYFSNPFGDLCSMILILKMVKTT